MENQRLQRLIEQHPKAFMMAEEQKHKHKQELKDDNS